MVTRGTVVRGERGAVVVVTRGTVVRGGRGAVVVVTRGAVVDVDRGTVVDVDRGTVVVGDGGYFACETPVDATMAKNETAATRITFFIYPPRDEIPALPMPFCMYVPYWVYTAFH